MYEIAYGKKFKTAYKKLKNQVGLILTTRNLIQYYDY